MPIDPKMISQGQKAGAEQSNKNTGLSEMIKTITNDLKISKASRLKQGTDLMSKRVDLMKSLISAEYTGDFNRFLANGDMGSIKAPQPFNPNQYQTGGGQATLGGQTLGGGQAPGQLAQSGGGATGMLSPPAQQPQQQGSQPPVIRSVRNEGVEYVYPDAVRKIKGIEAETQIQKEVEAQERKFGKKQTRNYRIAKSKLALAMRKYRAATEKFGGGRIGGSMSIVAGKAGLNPAYAAFKGHIVEAATAIAKIAAPSAKVGPNLIGMFATTLPTALSLDSEALDQVATSMTNAFINAVEANPEDYPEGVDFVAFEQMMLKALNESAVTTTRSEVGSQPSGKAQKIGRYLVEVE